MLSCHDNFEANFDNYPSMLSYHQALSMASSWRRCKVKDLHVEPLDPTSPLYGHPAAFAAGTSEDAIKDTAANLGLALNAECNVEESVMQHMDVERVRAALKELTTEERAIIQDFFFTESPIPVKELVEKYAMPKTSIYRKRDDVLKKLKKILGNA